MISYTCVLPHPPIILPEVGRGEEKQLEPTTKGFEQISRQVAGIRPETVVVVSPHAPAYADYFHISSGAAAAGDFMQFHAPQVKIRAGYDQEFVSALAALAGEAGVPAGPLGKDGPLDHGTMIPLYFLDKAYRDYKLVRVGVSGLSVTEHYRLGKLIAKTAKRLGRNTVLIASGDLSHKTKADGPYGFAKEGPEFDAAVMDALSKGDFLSLMRLPPDFAEAAAECGLRSILVMAGALDKKSVEAKVYSHQDNFGVGYGTASFRVTGADPARAFGEEYLAGEKQKAARARAGADPYVLLARESLEHYLKTGKYLAEPRNLPDGMEKRAGVFVSLKEEGRLRGCIGTIGPAQGNIAQEIIRNSVSAGTEDPRFDPVEESELPLLTYSVDVLSPPEPATREGLDPKEYGLIVSNGRRRGLLLPNLDGVATVDEQISIALQKAGIAPGEEYEIERFLVVRHT